MRNRVEPAEERANSSNNVTMKSEGGSTPNMQSTSLPSVETEAGVKYKTSTVTAAQKSATVASVDKETLDRYKRGMTRLEFIATMNASVRRNSALSFGSSRAGDMDLENLQPEARRRFLFDDKALVKGGRMKDLFKSEEPPEEDFNDVVDQDNRRVEVFVSQELVGEVIESFYFRVFIFGLIVINSLLIGLQTDEKKSVQFRYMFSIFDQAVLATFTCEIILKWYHGFWVFWKVGWNILDFAIIMALLLGPQLSFLSSSRILRILRVMRAFRSLRSISALAGLSMVVQTILQSVPDMANICLLLFIIQLMLGVAGVTLFGRLVPSHFKDLPTAIFSLFICVTQDGWVEIFKLFRQGSPTLHYGGAVYLFVAIMIGAFVFANLVVAVVVTNLEMAMKEMKLDFKMEEDVLATGEEVAQAGTEQPAKVPIMPFEEARKGVELSFQAPLQLMDLKGLSCDKLEKYYLVLIALESNLAEYQLIRKDVHSVFEMVKNLNVVEAEWGDGAPELPKQPRGSDIDLSELKKGDILSNLMKLEERHLISTKEGMEMDTVLKNAFEKDSHRRTMNARASGSAPMRRRDSVGATGLRG